MGDGPMLPGPKKAVDLGIVSCAADGCRSLGLALPRHDDRGQMVPAAPMGWGEISALDGDTELVLFVCSPSCERRLAAKLVGPRLGTLDG